ncbi:hypothetical protein ACFLY8_02265 [Halobacteriota archaeon]
MSILEFMSTPGVEALINIILVLTLVGITAYYAYQASKQADQAIKQTDIMEKEGKRRYIVELMKYIIAPLIHKLESEIGPLKKRYYIGTQQGLLAENINKLVVKPEILLNDLKRDFPDLKKKIENHDDKCQILQEKLKNLDEAIYTPGFKEKCHERIAEYNKRYDASDPKFLSKDPLAYSPIAFVRYIINNISEAPESENFQDFWREYGAVFLEIRDREDIKAKIDEIDRIVEGLKKISQELKEELEKLRDNYRQEYDISIGEFDESLLLTYMGD